MNNNELSNTKGGMEYEQYGSVAAAIASCVFKALSTGREIQL